MHLLKFNGSFYDQIDGIAMGSTLAPVLANLFMGHHEKLWLENFPSETLTKIMIGLWKKMVFLAWP